MTFTTLKLGSGGQPVTDWQQWFNRYAKSYAPPVDGYFGNADRDATRILQARLSVPVTGEFDEKTAVAAKYIKASASTPAHRPIWFYSAPGSGADWNVGPSFEVGEFCKNVLHINHQPLGYPKGGYLGLMGGDSAYSYNDVIGFEGAELERQLAACPDLNDPNVEFWFSGYSQSADGMEDALVRLFGDGGRFAHLRSRINGVIQFGNPSRQQNSNGGVPGYIPPGWGISRKIRPDWLKAKTRSVTNNGDFYACCDDEIRPLFYAEIIQADTELPFFVHLLKVAMPIILQTIPIFGGILGPLAPIALAAVTGLNAFLPLLAGMMGTANGSSEEVDQKLTQLLSVQGVISNIPALIKLIGALPGIQIHGEYHLGKPEFNGRSGIQVGCDVVAGFRRPT